MRDLSRLLRPTSIAVLGSTWAANVIGQCARMGYGGSVWPVHPTKPEIAGVPAFASLADLPAAPDACFVGVNRHATLEIVGQLSAMGAGGAIAFASGWSETGDVDLQASLVRAAGDMPVLGPNCYGVLNYLDGAAIWPDQHGGARVESGVAIISQSSSIAITLTMQRRGLPVAYMLCVGNAAQCGAADLGRALLDDPRVTALGFYLEGIDDAAALAALAAEARAAGKGVVALKGGKSESGARAAASHTASLAGEGPASTAFLKQAGIAEVATLADLIETLKILHHVGPLTGRRISATCCSGGEAGLTADLAMTRALTWPDPSPDPASVLSDVLGPLVTVANPLDYQTFIWGDFDKTVDVFSAMLTDVDAGLYVIDPPRHDRCDPKSFTPAIEAIAASGIRAGKPAFAVASHADSFDEALVARFAAQGTVALGGLDTALAAVEAAATEPARDGWRPWARPAPCHTVLLPEDTAKARLAAAGIAVPKGVSATRLADLPRKAAVLRAPFALKGLGFAHKTEAGAVRLNLTTLDGAAEMPGATGYLAEEMIEGGLAELILGARRNPVYGATLTLGLGGVAAELLSDVETLVLPVTEDEIAAAFRRLRLWPLLDGYRGRPRPDMAAAIAAAMALQSILAAAPEIEEVEINPLILTASGAVAADALIREAHP